MLGLAHRGFSMRDYGLHCVRHFNTIGYTTALAGVEHTAPEPDPGNFPQEDHRYCRPALPLPDTDATRRDMAAFVAAARRMDEKYGRILHTLGQSGLADSTLVCCFSDHGLQRCSA